MHSALVFLFAFGLLPFHVQALVHASSHNSSQQKSGGYFVDICQEVIQAGFRGPLTAPLRSAKKPICKELGSEETKAQVGKYLATQAQYIAALGQFGTLGEEELAFCCANYPKSKCCSSVRRAEWHQKIAQVFESGEKWDMIEQSQGAATVLAMYGAESQKPCVSALLHKDKKRRFFDQNNDMQTELQYCLYLEYLVANQVASECPGGFYATRFVCALAKIAQKRCADKSLHLEPANKGLMEKVYVAKMGCHCNEDETAGLLHCACKYGKTCKAYEDPSSPARISVGQNISAFFEDGAISENVGLDDPELILPGYKIARMQKRGKIEGGGIGGVTGGVAGWQMGKPNHIPSGVALGLPVGMALGGALGFDAAKLRTQAEYGPVTKIL